MGYHRDSFYEIKRAFQIGGVHALVEQKRGPRGPHPSRVSPEIEAEILQYSLDHPTRGQQRLANDLRLKGFEVSPGGVRNVWLRHELETRHKRLLRLETVAQGDTIILSEEQMQLLDYELGLAIYQRSRLPAEGGFDKKKKQAEEGAQFAFEGEFWNDELDAYRFVLDDRCVRRGAGQ